MNEVEPPESGPAIENAAAKPDPRQTRGRGEITRDRYAEATQNERRRRYHDRHMLLETVELDKAWVQAGKVGDIEVF